mmetsp:Transcript_90082/g.160414  ORF Transcript_90082/g.160414 Transcript_90082/m.160414 type:complete len:414 (-) Transcript_90082:66-1307(-)
MPPELGTEACQAIVSPPNLPPALPGSLVSVGRRGSKRSSAAAAAAASLSSSTPVPGRRSARPDSAPPSPSADRSTSGDSRSRFSERRPSGIQAPSAFETWRLDFDAGGHGAVRVSEFADLRPLTHSPEDEVRREAYGRPANKRDLGHRCLHCRRPFSCLGADLVAELQGGPSQRFHPECWKERNSKVPPVMLGSLPMQESSDSPSARGSARSSGAGSHRGGAGSARGTAASSSRGSGSNAIVTQYADEWRRSNLETESRYNRGPTRSSSARASVLDVNTVEDARGERRVARGFSRTEMEAAVEQWSCMSTSEEECAVCLLTRSKPLRLPCGHGFCCDCVEPWLRRCGLCPMCRQDVRPFLDTARGSSPGFSTRRSKSDVDLGVTLHSSRTSKEPRSNRGRLPPRGSLTSTAAI